MTAQVHKTLKIFNDGLLRFLQDSPTPFHAVGNMVEVLQQHGYAEIQESETWSLKNPGKYYIQRNQSSLIALSLNIDPSEYGFRMVGAHTDSPGLRLKPNAEVKFKNLMQTGTEIYGGVLMNPWFDRDLSLAGRIYYQDDQEHIHSTLVDFKKPMAIIPSLAIHLDKDVNQNKSINAQKELIPLWGHGNLANDSKDFLTLLKEEIQNSTALKNLQQILSYELYFYDTQAPSYLGWNQEFIASARLDNLLSCYVGLQALINASNANALLICNDHEEVGSNSAVGADGSFLKDVLERLCPIKEDYVRAIQQSYFISCDNAHGIHPNYSEKHDPNHGPLLNAGPAIKINSNQRYATNSETEAIFIQSCEKAKVPYQKFVVRSDMGCGSTIGPITAAKLGVKTVDVGVPSFAMHSIRELVGSQDGYYLCKVLEEFFKALFF